MNRNLLVGIPVFLFLLTLLYWQGCFSSNGAFFRTVPETAIIVVDIHDVDAARQHLQETNYWLDMQNVDAVRKLEENFAVFDSIFLQNSSQKQQQKRIVGSLHLTKADDYDYLMLLHKSVLGTSLDRVIKALKRQGHRINTRMFNNVSIYELKIPQFRRPFTIASNGKVIMCSFSPLLVDEAISQGQKGRNRSVMEMMAWHDKNADASIYVNFENFPFLSTIFLKSPNSNSLFNQISNYLKWSQLDIRFENRSLLVNGNTEFNQEDKLLNTLLYQSAGESLQLPNYLPFNTAFLLHSRVSSFAAFNRKFKRKQAGKTTFFEEHFLPWVGNEWGYGFTEPSGANFAAGSFIAIKIGSPAKVTEHLTALSNKEKQRTHKNHTIYNGDVSGLGSYFYNDGVAKDFADAYFTIIDDFAFFASKHSQIQVIIDKHLSGQTLQKEAGFVQFAEKLNESSNLFVYIQPTKLKKLLKAYASPRFSRDIDTRFKYYERVSPVAADFDYSRGMARTTGVLSYQKNNLDKTTLLWSTSLEEAPATPPQVVTNHLTGEKEIMIQDKNHMLYLISKGGDIVWKKKLDELLLDKIYQIDFYNNGNLQYLFNTKARIYLINRRGQDVHNFPIRLSAEANTGLTLIDFDNNKEKYKFFIPCKNKLVYGYEYSGKPLPGWSPRRYLANVSYPLVRYKYRGRDYVVGANDLGLVFILDEYGNMIQKVETKQAPMGIPQIDEREGVKKVVVANVASQIYVLNGKGEYFNSSLMKAAPDAQFLTTNVLGSKAEENIFLSDGEVYYYNHAEKMFVSKLKEHNFTPSHMFAVSQANNEPDKIGLFSKTGQKIILLDKYGLVYPDFPIPASTPFIITDLFASNENILLAGGTDKNVLAYKVK